MAIVRREVSDRTVMGKIVKWLFILFNLFMIFALFKGCAGASDIINNAQSEAERAGASIGTAIGVGMIGVVWVIGDIIIGTVVLLTRRKKIIEVEE
jgi:hypothetical protein